MKLTTEALMQHSQGRRCLLGRCQKAGKGLCGCLRWLHRPPTSRLAHNAAQYEVESAVIKLLNLFVYSFTGILYIVLFCNFCIVSLIISVLINANNITKIQIYLQIIIQLLYQTQ